MLSWVVTFLVVALIAGILGFGGVAGVSIEIAKAIFFIAVILFVMNQSNRITLRRWLVREDGRLRETDAPAVVGENEVIVLQPYGSLFFASAPVFEEELPEVTTHTDHSVVILRLRGKGDLGSTFMEVLSRYSTNLTQANSKLVLVYSDARVRDQLRVTGVLDLLTEDNVYESDEWLGATVVRAHEDALEWIRSHSSGQ